jgi:hypothetical protein
LFRAADYDTNKSVVVAKVMERLGVSKQRIYRFQLDILNLKKLNNSEGKE